MTSTESTVDTLLRSWLPAQRWFAGDAARSVVVRRSVHLTPDLRHLVVSADTADYQVLLARHGDRWLPATERPDLLVGLLASPFLTLAPGVAVTGPARLLDVEQTNTSIVFGERHVLKLFRRLLPGAHPEIELHQALRAAGNPHVADLAGWLTTELAGAPVALGVLHGYLPDAVDGWSLALTGADFIEPARELGRALAAVHTDLAGLGTAPADPAGEARRMRRRLTGVLAEVPALRRHEPGLRAVFDAVRALPAGSAPAQRVHGDLHLGQVLRSAGRWRLIDFEGEPGRPLAERAELRPALLDVAGMLRSFDYAAHHPAGRSGSDWAAARAAFLAGYDAPRSAEMDVLLHALELDKAVYEVGYEHAHRPDWLPIPLAAVARLLSRTGSAR